MRITISCCSCAKKFFLRNDCATRKDLAYELGESFLVSCPHCDQKNHSHINETKAEATIKAALIGTTLWCGAVGLLAGPVGGGIGVLLGAYAGYRVGSREGERARLYNNSYL